MVHVAGSFSAVGTATRHNIASFPITSVSWGGSDGGSWNSATNWNEKTLPSSSLDVSIASGKPIMDVDFTVGSGKTLDVSGAGSLEIAAGNRLTVAGTADFNGRPVILRSSATGTASIGQVTGTLSDATNVTVERYIPAGRKWRLLTAPLTGSSANTVFANWQNNGSSSGATGVEIWGPTGSDPSATGLTSGPTTAYSMRKYGTSNNWLDVTNTKTEQLFNATTNNGFILFVTGQYGSTNLASGSAATTLSATGSLISGIHTKTLSPTANGQYFLVGNPYASPVNPASFTATGTVNRTNLDNILYMWDASQSGDLNVGRYVSFDIDGGVYNTGDTYLGSTQIQSGQAFFVRATTANQTTSLVFREASKSSASSNAMLGNSSQTLRQSVRIQLLRNGVTMDGAVAFFHAGASAEVDAQDGVKMMNANDNLGFRRSGKTLVFEHRPELKTSDTLYLSLTQMRTGAFQMRIKTEGMTIDEGLRLELVDRLTQTRRELSLTEANTVDFTVDDQAGSSVDRYIVVLSSKSAVGGTTSEPNPVANMNPYPNPLSGSSSVRVDIDRERAPWNMTLTDAAGRTLWNLNGVDSSKQYVEIGMSRFGAGVYNLIMTDGRGRRSVSRIVKQ